MAELPTLRPLRIDKFDRYFQEKFSREEFEEKRRAVTDKLLSYKSTFGKEKK
jgi:hypothetical protein